MFKIFYERKERMKFFINFKLLEIGDEEKENIRIKVFELMSFAIEKFCGNDKSRLHYMGIAVWEAMYNSVLHAAKEFLEVRTGIACRKRLIFLIKDNSNFYQNKEIKEAVKNKDLEKLRNFKPNKKSGGYGFEIIFESKPKIKILNGTLCLIWEKALG